MPTVRDFHELLEQSQWWQPEKLVAWQRQQLQLLLTRARSSSPYYKFRLNKIFRNNGTIDWDRWHEIPIVTRRDVLARAEAIRSTAPPGEHRPFFEYQSSGSTGHPVKGWTTQWLLDTSAACKWRAHQWAGLDWSRTMLLTAGLQPNRKVGESMGPWGPPWVEAAQGGRLIYSPYGLPFLDRIALIEEHGATYYETTAPSAELLVEVARLGDLHIRLDKVLTRGGAVSDLLRSDLRNTLGADVVEFYSSKECGAIAQHCPIGHYHINAETVLFEVVDANGLPVAPGESGRAVITPFFSTAFPLIRYDQGDIVVAGQECECGRVLPVIASISGREANFFTDFSGRKFDRGLSQECRELIGAGQVQIAQVGRLDFEIRYVPRDWGVARDEARFVEKFRKIFFPEANAKLVEMKEIPLSPSGKYLASIVEWREGEPS